MSIMQVIACLLLCKYWLACQVARAYRILIGTFEDDAVLVR